MALFQFSLSAQDPPPPPPIKALLVTGGASHEYTTRKDILVQGIRERIKRPIEWMVKHQGDGESDVRIPLFEETEWAKGYDIVVHDYCFPRVRAGDYIDRILAPHRAGLPAVLIHGALLSFQTPDDRWASFTGATIRGHEQAQPLLLEPLNSEAAILKHFVPWALPGEELYRVDRLAPGASALINALPLQPIDFATLRPSPLPLVASIALPQPPTRTPVTWTHLYGAANTKVFATTLGNDLGTLITPAYLDLVARGFLWALNDLSETTFVIVPPDQSLPGFKIAIPGKPLPETGPNPARRGSASALASGTGEGTGPDRAIDGKTSTYWESDAAGPSSWQVALPEAATIGAIALIWKEGPPAALLLEGSPDGRSWQPLADTPLENSDPTLLTLSFNPLVLSYLRVSIPETSPGYVPGIREFAVYPSRQDLPSGLFQTQPVGNSEVPFRTVAPSGFGRTLRLAPAWSLAASLPWEKGLPIQFIPTASGKIFLLTEAPHRQPTRGSSSSASASPDHGPKTKDPRRHDQHRPARSVHLLSPPSDDTIPHSLYLDRLPPGTVISWDGEWLYTFSGGTLDAYRHLNGEGPANERHRVGKVFALPATTSFDDLQFSDLQQRGDGSFTVRFTAPRPWEAVDSRGASVHLPAQGIARFHRSGEGFTPWHEPVSEEGRGDDPLDGTALHEIAHLEGLLTAARDGRHLWIASRNAAGTTLACLEDTSAQPLVPVVWDQVNSEALFEHLDSIHASVRREVFPEILRRKRDPASEIQRQLSLEPSPELTSRLLFALTSLNPSRSLAALVSMGQSTDPARQILAFRQLGDHPLARDHPVFQQITTSTTPAVTIEILHAIQHSDTEIRGLEELVLSFTSHPDPGLAAASRAFLIRREASSPCFSALDDPGQASSWPGAFDVLAGIKRATVAEGLVLRLEQTTSAAFRRLGLEALCRLSAHESEDKLTGAASRLVDSFLQASLRDRRVDRPLLLDTMRRHGIPVARPQDLVEEARRDLSLESVLLEALRLSDQPLRPETIAWLDDLRKSPSRDAELRARAGQLIEGAQDEVAVPPRMPSVGAMPLAGIMERITALPPENGLGRRLFRHLSCDTCHNIHGEGPVFGPDLASAAGTLAPAALVRAILDPSAAPNPRFPLSLLELDDGRQWKGHLESRSESELSLRDQAGNLVLLPASRLRFEWPAVGSLMPCQATRELSLSEFAALFHYLQSLAPPSQ